MPPLKLLLVRHGQSVGNVEGRMEGFSSTGLTPWGVEQSLRLGRHLAAKGWYPTHTYCSPLERATETLSALVQGFTASRSSIGDPLPNIPKFVASERSLDQVALAPDQTVTVELRSELMEYNSGIFTGLTWAEACDRYPDLCQRLTASLDWQPIPEAETLEQGQARAQQFVDYVLSRHGNSDRILVIGHHWILQHVISGLLGCDRAWGLPMDNTAQFEFWLDRDRWHQTGPNRLNTELWQIKRFNDTTHLQGPG
ncbi:histidine phosphatase family protein [Nodosilinea sp. LEGE 06152]|uniref:histidine phosphatase family protein n=1 Tax=Nodosilinea sp. LEGE 06152 TaxID=2777966 RepID=UPI0018809D6C|nr:histidine phosphatase family protein [Nodosilinea sp. LEGE 06152]MBE9160410.1 histidine phosphatase family protein [Nodosilinea sp. LEGE 06152]